MMMQEENHRKLHHPVFVVNDPTGGMAFIANERFYQDKFRSNMNDKRFPNSFDNSRSTYFCDRCKIPGHSIQRCWKLHDYPQNFKNDRDKKFSAAVIQNEDEAISSNDHLGFTPTQYQQLLQLIGKDKGKAK